MSSEIDKDTIQDKKELSERSNIVQDVELVSQASATATVLIEKKDDTKKISKNQLKRKFKWERAMNVKRRRKDQVRNIKIAKAKAEGRDIIAEKEDMERRRKDGSGWAKRNEIWQERYQKNSSKHQIYLDCSFEESMTYSEINSLATQLRFCYASNKKAKHPVKVTCSSLGGRTHDHLKNLSGFEQWIHRAFFHTNNDIIGSNKEKSKLVYLTSDSENILTNLEDDKIYIIGGIVDRGRLKNATIDRAEKFGIETAKLPIGKYLSLVSTNVLTCNHVFDILLKCEENNGDWKKALLDVLPKKKEAKEKLT